MFNEGRIDIPAFLKAAGWRYFHHPSKILTAITLYFFPSDNTSTVEMVSKP